MPTAQVPPRDAEAPGEDSSREPRAGARRPIPPRLARALERAHAAELAARGHDRVPALRLTRSMLGGARLAGYSAHQLAACIGASAAAIRNRGGADGWITAAVFIELTGLPSDVVEQWRSAGALPSRTIDETGDDCYRASELIIALKRRELSQSEPQASDDRAEGSGARMGDT